MWAHTKVLVAGPRLQKTFANRRYKGASDLSSPLILSLHLDSSRRREKEEPPAGGAISLGLTMHVEMGWARGSNGRVLASQSQSPGSIPSTTVIPGLGR